MKIALIGFGDLGHYIKDMLVESVDADGYYYFDDALHASGAADAFPFASHLDDRFADAHFYVCLGYRHLKLKNEIFSNLAARGRTLPNFIHPSSYVHPTVKLGAGSFVYPGCSIDRNTKIGRGVWIANADVIAHDSVIGDACWFGASVTLSGKVTVGSCTFIGSGTTISNDVHIGSNVIIGLSSSVTKNIADGVSAIGNPLRILEKPIKLV